MADEHTFTLIFEADGVVTPARPTDQPDDEDTDPEPENEPDPEEAEQ